MHTLLQKFIKLESSGGIMLFMMALLSMLLANSPFALIQQAFNQTLLPLINEGLMSVFFLLVGLELKRGFFEGDLSTRSQIMLPACGALGGMLVPALIYLGITASDPITMRGLATPIATDIAFALGVLSFFGRAIPIGLKLFLLALAIFDDIGAIIVIVFFHSAHLSYPLLLQAMALTMVLYLLNRIAVKFFIPYLFIGCWLWLCLFYGGIHPTVAGVILAIFIPSSTDHSRSLLHQMENKLYVWVVYLIMPLFALTNAGFSLQGLSYRILTEKVVLGITCGLFIGKQLGVFGFSWLLIRLRLASLPSGSSWLSLYGVSLLCGIGFTMSLFLGTLSFQNAR